MSSSLYSLFSDFQPLFLSFFFLWISIPWFHHSSLSHLFLNCKILSEKCSMQCLRDSSFEVGLQWQFEVGLQWQLAWDSSLEVGLQWGTQSSRLTCISWRKTNIACFFREILFQLESNETRVNSAFFCSPLKSRYCGMVSLKTVPTWPSRVRTTVIWFHDAQVSLHREGQKKSHSRTFAAVLDETAWPPHGK